MSGLPPLFLNRDLGFRFGWNCSAQCYNFFEKSAARLVVNGFLRSVVTYSDPEEPDLFVQDSASGIWVNLEIVKSNVPLNIGEPVEVESVTEAPDFALQVAARDSP